MADSSLLIGDIGGTNARFALADKSAPGFSDLVTLQCADYATVDAAIRDYLDSVGALSPDVICLAVAGPVVEQCVQFTNNHWAIASDELATAFSTSKTKLLNDFVAIAHSIPFLSGDDCQVIGPPGPKLLDKAEYTVAIIGPGTGLGISGLHKQGDSYTAISGEASHSGFAPESDLQVEILSALRRKFDRVSIERVVSGPGLENIYWALSRIRNEKRAQLSAAEIFAKVNDASDPLAVEAVQLFFEILGQVAGDIALAFGAEDGVFIAGGIVRRYAELLADSRFRSGFESKGRHRPILQRIPTQLILHEQPGLLGVSCCALELLDIDIRTGERV